MPQACLHGYKCISRYMVLWVNACIYIIDQKQQFLEFWVRHELYTSFLLNPTPGRYLCLRTSTIAQEQWNKNSNSFSAAAASSSSSLNLTFVTHGLPSCNLFPVTLLLFVSRQFFARFFCLFSLFCDIFFATTLFIPRCSWLFVILNYLTFCAILMEFTWI